MITCQTTTCQTTTCKTTKCKRTTCRTTTCHTTSCRTTKCQPSKCCLGNVELLSDQTYSNIIGYHLTPAVGTLPLRGAAKRSEMNSTFPLFFRHFPYFFDISPIFSIFPLFFRHFLIFSTFPLFFVILDFDIK
jgi:hypothetical protein